MSLTLVGLLSFGSLPGGAIAGPAASAPAASAPAASAPAASAPAASAPAASAPAASAPVVEGAASASAGRSLFETPAAIFSDKEALNSLRDPFRRPEFTSADRPKTELETMSTDQFRLLGIVTGPKELKAMLLGPNNKTYIVMERTLIGTRGGLIVKIRPNGLTVKEKVVNVMGQEEPVDIDIPLPTTGQNSGSR